MSSDIYNLSSYIPLYAEKFPQKEAIRFPLSRSGNQVNYETLNFAELEERIQTFVAGFKGIGIRKGMRVSLMVKPGLDFLPLTFALFRLGAVPVLIDPGMGRKNLLRCVAAARPEAFVGIPLAHVARLLFGSYFKTVKINVTIGKRFFWGGYNTENLKKFGKSDAHEVLTPNDPAAIIYTTGSTGPPKGVNYTQKMFLAQKKLLQESFNLTDEDIDMPAFALFSIFTLAMGCTVVIPDMDQTKPAEVNPDDIIGAIKTAGVTFSFGSPALWNTVSKFCIENNVKLPGLKKIFMAGAPVQPFLHERLLKNILDSDAQTYTPYGATESLPTTSFSGTEVLTETAVKTQMGKGFCVGPVLPGIKLKIINLSDEVIEKFDLVKELPQGEIGEIIVQGDVVSPSYFDLPDKTAEHKIYEEDGTFWHRIGDLGYIDEHNRLWMCGRKGHRVEYQGERYFTVCCEAIFNQHEDVNRSALVPASCGKPIMIIEPVAGRFPQTELENQKWREELKDLAASNDQTKSIQEFMFHESFPVDIRHNAKIFREKLSFWAHEEEKK
ncbi:MAG: fatty acid CoA ligase family protein [Lentisphaeria bacterium]|nr:fatty acid CoA ligase family protein [Lentisphaeria bacterium]